MNGKKAAHSGVICGRCKGKVVPEPTSDVVTRYLKAHPEFLEHFLIENVGLDELQRWVIRRMGGPKQLDTPEQ